ncbi:MAG TPA: FecR domain-containing protein [Hymenobacter sp.]|jgi:ferric-dicitrate binding protein FerR (iron transport regulator)
MMHDLYSTEELLADESFQAFVFDTDAEAVRLWHTWISQHPDQEAEFYQAVELLQLLTANRPLAPTGLKHNELQKLLRVMEQEPTQPSFRLMTRLRARKQRTLAALGVGLLLTLGGGAWWLRATSSPDMVGYVTRYGEQRRILLPDGSKVVLNANSTLKTAKNWESGRSREVWLSGEAYFSVTHKAAPTVKAIDSAPQNVKFIVHSGSLEIAVLGTKFDVFSRNHETRVVLSSGKVQLSRRTNGQDEKVLMNPGELVEYTSPRRQPVTRVVNAAHYSSWTSGKLSFDDNSLAQIIRLLHETYGLEITVADPSLLAQKVSGSVPSRDADVLLMALSKSLDMKVIRTGNQIRLEAGE